MAFQFLNFCTGAKKKSFESQAVFLTSATEAAHQMKGMCEIAFPSISVSMLRTHALTDTVRRTDHAAPSDVKLKKKNIKKRAIQRELCH